MSEEQIDISGPEYKGKWTALYMPALPDNAKNPSRYDFDSKDEAEQYIFGRMCTDCKEGRQRVIDGTSDPDNNEDHLFDSEWPGCACEWEAVLTHELAGCETMDDVMNAAGYKVIWSKPTQEQENMKLQIELTKREAEVVEELAAKKDLTPEQVLLQALRLYQLHDAGITEQDIHETNYKGAGWPGMD